MRKIAVLLFVLCSLAASASAQQLLKRGDVAPVFEGQFVDGQPFDYAQLQGKIVLLTFWSTRCQICHSEIPKLNQVAERYKDRDVVFLAATMDNAAKVQAFTQKVPFNFGLLANSFGVMLKYADRDAAGNINMGFPAHFIINRDGTIAARSYGWDKASQIDSELAKMLGEN